MVLLGSLGSLGSPKGSPQCNSGHMTADIMLYAGLLIRDTYGVKCSSTTS